MSCLVIFLIFTTCWKFIGYSVVRSLSEAPRYASLISDILRNRVPAQYLAGSSQNYSPSMLGKYSFGGTTIVVLHHFWTSAVLLCKVHTSGKNFLLLINVDVSAWRTLWPQERKRQRSFFLFGLALIIQLNNEGIQTFFEAFFRVPKW